MWKVTGKPERARSGSRAGISSSNPALLPWWTEEHSPTPQPRCSHPNSWNHGYVTSHGTRDLEGVFILRILRRRRLSWIIQVNVITYVLKNKAQEKRGNVITETEVEWWLLKMNHRVGGGRHLTSQVQVASRNWKRPRKLLPWSVHSKFSPWGNLNLDLVKLVLDLTHSS